jgi:hypothetical protein
MTKINSDLPVILIDTSYWLYYRFFSLRNWYSHAYPENYVTEVSDVVPTTNFNATHNWLEDELFMTKYKKLFIDNIKKLCKRYKTKLENVILCIDCPHNEIWRHSKVKTENEKINIKNETIMQRKKDKEKEQEQLDEEQEQKDEEPIIENIKPYKGTRLESHKKNNFNSFNIFNYMKTTFIPTLKDNNNNSIKIIQCSKCEADDIIGQLSVYIDQHWQKQYQIQPHTQPHNQKKIYILANDNDYLQVCNNNIKLMNGLGKILSGEQGENYYGDKYLISKILLGDKSDNIKSCTIDSGYLHCGIPNNKIKNITKKNIESIFANPEKYTIFTTLLNTIRNSRELDSSESSSGININLFTHNCNMMDFQMLPQELKINLHNLFTQII